MTGRYTGWVNDGVRSRLGIAADAAAAWEGGGGGAFERRPPKGESAKEFARAQLRKNPNAYFYRHNPPGEETWQGEWGEARAPGVDRRRRSRTGVHQSALFPLSLTHTHTLPLASAQDEVALFVSVATSHGCGDKWGLFASHVPHRVGYQCSAAYRHILLPRGLLRDDQYRMTLSGEAVYVGRGGGRNKRRRAGGDEGDE